MGSMTAAGSVAVGRQVAAPPVTHERTILLGAHRHAVIETAAKGARPELKVIHMPEDHKWHTEALTLATLLWGQRQATRKAVTRLCGICRRTLI